MNSMMANIPPRNKNKLGTLFNTSSFSKYLAKKYYTNFCPVALHATHLSSCPSTDTGETLSGLTYAVSKGFQMIDP